MTWLGLIAVEIIEPGMGGPTRVASRENNPVYRLTFYAAQDPTTELEEDALDQIRVFGGPVEDMLDYAHNASPPRSRSWTLDLEFWGFNGIQLVRISTSTRVMR